MRANIVLSGIILIVIGIILVGIGINIASESNDQRDMLTGLGLENIGEYVTAGGIIAFCIGLFLQEKMPQILQPIQQPHYPQQPYQQQYQQPRQRQL